MTDYIALEEVKHTLELSNLTYADEDLRLAISSASRGIEDYCGRVFFTGGTAETRYFTSYDYRCVEIDDLITINVNPVVMSDYDGDGVYESTWTLNTDYLLQPLNAPAFGKPYKEIRIHPRGTQRFSVYPRGFQVTGQFGWDAVPEPVKSATGIMAERLMRRARDAPFGVVGIGLDNAAVRIPSVDPDVRFLL